MPFNRCGVYHLGRCCVNGAGPGRPTCSHCDQEIDQQERLQIARSFTTVQAIKFKALGLTQR